VLANQEKAIVGIAQQGGAAFAIAGQSDGLESVQRLMGGLARCVVAIQPALRAQFERPGQACEQEDRD